MSWSRLVITSFLCASSCHGMQLEESAAPREAAAAPSGMAAGPAALQAAHWALLVEESSNSSGVMESTASLSQEQVQERQTEFGAIIAGSSGLLLLTAVLVFLKRSHSVTPGYTALAKQESRGELPREKSLQSIDLKPATPKPRKCLECESELKPTEGLFYCEACGPSVAAAGPGMGPLTPEEMDVLQAKEDGKQENNVDATAEEEQMATWAREKGEQLRGDYPAYTRARWWGLVALFLLYVTATIGLPLAHWQQATCARGFFWEVHMQFLAVFVLTKVVELLLCALDPLVEFDGSQPLWKLFLTWVPSFMGYVDAYTDATGVAISHSCPQPLAQLIAKFMFVTFVGGVVILQWVYMFCLAAKDPSHACLFKLLHMDLLANMTSLPVEYKSTWNRLALVRTFAEDLPQAVLQSLYIAFVNKNLFMLVSVLMAVGSSIRALHEARARQLATAAARDAFQRRERKTELYSCSQDATIRCWNTTTGELKRTMRAESPTNELAAVGGKLYSAHDDGVVREWSLETGKVTRTFQVFDGEAHETTDGRLVATHDKLYCWTADYRGPHRFNPYPIKEFSIVTGMCLREFGSISQCAALHVEGSRLFSNGGEASAVDQWELGEETPTCTQTFQAHTRVVTAIRSTPKRLFTASAQDCTVREWSLQTGACTRTFPDYGSSRRFSHSTSGILLQGGYLYSPATTDNVVHVWNLGTGDIDATLEGHEGPIVGLTLLHGKLYTCSSDFTIIEWDLEKQEPQRRLEGHTDEVFRLMVQQRDTL